MSIRQITVRFIGSVVAGLATSTVLSTVTHEVLHLCGVFPPVFKPIFETRLVIISLIYHSIYAVTGAFITAWLARDKARKAVFFLGSKEAIMWLIGTVLLWKHAPVWFNVTKALIGIPLALLGGKLYELYKLKKGGKEQLAKDTSKSIVDLKNDIISK